MNTHYFKTTIFLFIIFFLFACNENNNTTTYQPVEKDKAGLKDTLKKINKYLLKVDAERIESYIKRHDWNTKTTQTGLWYEIYKHGNGKATKPNDIVKFSFRIELLDGTVCYNSDSTGVKKIKIGKGGVESGLQQGLLLMKVGDKAHFIMPPYMAHGILGDFERIPARATIVYDVELLEITDF